MEFETSLQAEQHLILCSPVTTDKLKIPEFS